jgi:hypothetical protein
MEKNVQDAIAGLNELSEGYRIIREALSQTHSKEEMEPYLLKDEIFQEDRFNQALEEKGSLQGAIGYSDEMCSNIFKLAIQLQEEKRFEESRKALLFLLMLKPFNSTIWMGFGRAYQGEQLPKEALYAYLVAINCAPFKLEPYAQAIHFCLSTQQGNEAMRIVEYGIELAATHPLKEEEKELPDQLKAIKAYIQAASDQNSR